MSFDGKIAILCPDCGNAARVPRTAHDYPEAVRLEVQCGECGQGNFPEPFYFDRAGEHITRDPDDVLPVRECK